MARGVGGGREYVARLASAARLDGSTDVHVHLAENDGRLSARGVDVGPVALVLGAVTGQATLGRRGPITGELTLSSTVVS